MYSYECIFNAQFNYCTIIWMFHSRCLNNEINRLHERYLRVVYNDKISNFEKLLNKDNSVSIHHNSIHALAIEMYKVANDMSPDIMNGVFKLRNTPHYNLRHTSHFSKGPIHSVYNGTESVSYLGPRIWEPLDKDFLDGFKKKNLKNGNLLSAHVEFVRLLYQIEVLFDKNSSIFHLVFNF